MTLKKLKELFIPLTGLALFSLASPSQAASWSSVATGCIPDSDSANRVKSSAISSSVSFKGSSIGLIRLTCPISGFREGVTNANAMAVNYYDPDNRGTTCQVRAFLLRTNLNELERGNTIQGFNSNTGSSVTEPGTGRSMGTVGLPETIDFNSNYYWIDLELSRLNTSCNPIAVGVQLIDEIVVL